MAKKPKLLSDLFHDTLKDVYFAENRILKTLPKMAKAGAGTARALSRGLSRRNRSGGHASRFMKQIIARPRPCTADVARSGSAWYGSVVRAIGNRPVSCRAAKRCLAPFFGGET